MIQLNNKDADFLARLFRKLLERSFSKLKDCENINEIISFLPIDAKIDKNEAKNFADELKQSYNEDIENYEKAILLCTVGS